MDQIIRLLSDNKPQSRGRVWQARGGAIHHPFKQKQVQQEESQKNKHANDRSMTSFHSLPALTEKADARQQPARLATVQKENRETASTLEKTDNIPAYHRS